MLINDQLAAADGPSWWQLAVFAIVIVAMYGFIPESVQGLRSLVTRDIPSRSAGAAATGTVLSIIGLIVFILGYEVFAAVVLLGAILMFLRSHWLARR